MKKIILFSIICTYLLPLSESWAQKKAITETGEEVILYENGTWEYADSSSQTTKEIITNSTNFTKSSSASFLLKSKKNNIGVWLDSKKWSFKKAVNNSEAEYEFQLKGEDLYGMLISEKIEIPLENLKEIALQNAKEVAPDLKVIKEEYRNVNGLKVFLMQMDGTTQGIKFSYYGYYFSNRQGTVQFVTYTAQNLLKNYLKEAELFLNGLVELQ
jgi:hypothetical protein